MLELPEAAVMAKQLNTTVCNKRVRDIIAAQTPHKLTWYYGDRLKYSDLLPHKIINKANAYGGLVEIQAGDTLILFGDGVGIRFHQPDEPRPPKHQLLIEFEDSSALSASVQMYGGLGCFRKGELDNPYYKAAREKPAPLSNEFDKAYFLQMISQPEIQKLSLKAFLATEQRIPGLGNGILQDILFNAGMHPKRKINTLSEKEQDSLFKAVKDTISQMISQGGRDTERDLFGNPGGYLSHLSKNTAGKPCRVCGTLIKKEAYLGGSIYYCSHCQKLE